MLLAAQAEAQGSTRPPLLCSLQVDPARAQCKELVNIGKNGKLQPFLTLPQNLLGCSLWEYINFSVFSYFMCFLSQQSWILKLEVLLYYFYHQFSKIHPECELIAFLWAAFALPWG